MAQLLQFLAGLGLFLFAMYLMEEALRKLAGRTFKLFLRKHTTNTLEAVGSSTLVTALLQSSSVVIVMTISFVGAGIISMRNALAMVVGSNFGTTIDNWLVATVGFQVDVSFIAFPLVAVGCCILAFTAEGRKLFHYAKFILGFGFLFLGLNYMQESMTLAFKDFDITPFSSYPSIVFVLIGFILTAIIQASSATMAILLSALHTGEIPFEIAAAAVIGSELGTTVKIVLGSLKGVAAKRQLAIGNVVFNIVITTLAFIFLVPLCKLSAVVGRDPLLRLVFFQSTINLAGVIIFFPFLNQYARLLEKFISGAEEPSTFVVGPASLQSAQLAIDALDQDTNLLLYRVLRLNQQAFATRRNLVHIPPDFEVTIHERNRSLTLYQAIYDDLKKAEGEILMYALKLIDQYPEEHKRVDELVAAVRYAMHSAKAMKDVRHNRIEFRESGNDTKHNYYEEFKDQLESLYTTINELISNRRGEGTGDYDAIFSRIRSEYADRQNRIYDAAQLQKLDGEDLSSLLNVNRELYTSCKTILLALRLYHEGDHRTYKFEEFP